MVQFHAEAGTGGIQVDRAIADFEHRSDYLGEFGEPPVHGLEPVQVGHGDGGVRACDYRHRTEGIVR